MQKLNEIKCWIITNEIKNEINNSKENLVKDSDISKNIDSEIKKVKSEMDSVSGTIKREL